MNRFVVTELPLAGLRRVERRILADERGSFARLFCSGDLESAWPLQIAQINHTSTARRGTIRGLHFQTPPHAETKLVSCLHGEVWDIAVDLRQDSPTFLQWHAEILSPANAMALLIPEGFAHGFQTLTDNVEMLYLHSAAYVPHAEGGLHPQDPLLKIAWPLEISSLSARDANHPMLKSGFQGIPL